MKRAATNLDIALGARIRELRTRRGMSQTVLAHGLGISFQQIQKYEKGANRISVSRLQQLADLLDLPISTFLPGMPDDAEPSAYSTPELFRDSVDGLELMRAFQRIESTALRERILTLVKAFAEEPATSNGPA